MSSVYVVCWIFLQTFQTYFSIQANCVDPDQAAPRGAVWSGSTLFPKMTFKNHKQMTKQTTIVVIGSLRIKGSVCVKLFQLTMCCFYPNITKTYLYNFDPLKPHFYIVKLGFTGVYIIFLISAQNIDCGYSLELPQWGSSNEYPQSMFCADIWKISEFFI